MSMWFRQPMIQCIISGLHRIFETFTVELNDTMKAIELSHLQFYYPNHPNHIVLNIPSWSIEEGERIFIYGPSGGGKSTLLGLISGLVVPVEGQVTVFGKHLNIMTPRQRDRFRAEHIGYVFQKFNLIPYLTAIENTQLASRFSKHTKVTPSNQDIQSLLSRLNIPKKDWHRQTRHLSIGQQQRIAIARALINKPQLLIADEPTSSLDASNKEEFLKLLMSVVADTGMTLVFVSHDMSLSPYFKQVKSLNEINQLEGAA